MALIIEDLLTREEIRDTLINYSQGLDQRNWDLFDSVWTKDATFTGPDEGIEDLPVGEFKKLLQANDDDRLSGQHLIANTHFQIDGDTAHTVTEVQWETQQQLPKPGLVFTVKASGIYVDDLVKTEQGWRISKRVLVTKFRETRGAQYSQEHIDNIKKYSLNTNWYK